jgi:hypothetical protein
MSQVTITMRDREQARELEKAIFGDHLSEGGREHELICQALAAAREPFTKPAVPEPAPHE